MRNSRKKGAKDLLKNFRRSSWTERAVSPTIFWLEKAGLVFYDSPVILQHSGTHYSWYWHLRSNSVAVAVGQVVRAGTQIGLVGSNGVSTGPHLHFESHYNGAVYEPSAGACRPGPSGWVSQIPIRRDLYLEQFAT